MLGVCRTGASFDLPSGNANTIDGTGIFWYDTNQEHILTDLTFRNCGYRSDQFNQYDNSPTRGCGAESLTGCDSRSSVWKFTSTSNIFTPEIMQATRGVKFENCGRRFAFQDTNSDTNSGRHQNWIDVDGSVTGFGEPSIIGSGINRAKDWWTVDDEGKSFLSRYHFAFFNLIF